MINHIWERKYEPHSLNDYIFVDNIIKEKCVSFITQQDFPHLLFHGNPGSGKTSLAKLLMHECGVEPHDQLIINASDKNSVDDIRDIIKNFIQTMPFGKFKVVLLDEADYMSHSGQGILRHLLSDSNNPTKFILTCNYVHKITEPLRSRCQEWQFNSLHKGKVREMLLGILIKENISKVDIEIIDNLIEIHYPDIRKIINSLQQSCNNDELKNIINESTNIIKQSDFLSLLIHDQWTELTECMLTETTESEYIDRYQWLYTNIIKSKKFSENTELWEEGIIIIADYLDKHRKIADPRINLNALLIELKHL